MRPFFFILSIALTSISCVKDEGIISEANNSNGTTSGGTTSGSTTGSTTGGGTSSLTDPLLSESWHYHSDGTGKGYSASLAQSDADINVKLVHDVLGIKGKGIRIAVSDSGVETAHPDLADNTLSGEHRNYVYTDPGSWANSDPTPGSGSSEPHGTSVAGLISAIGWNGIGSRGIAPLSKFAAFKYIFTPLVIDEESLIAKEIDQLTGDFDIFNQSYGKAGYFFVESDTLVETALRANTLGTAFTTALRNGKGAIYIQAAGNSFAESYVYPGTGTNSTRTASGNTNAHEELATPFKIVVGALSGMSHGTYGMRASYSTPGSSIWISAPGGEDGLDKPAMITTDMETCRIGYSFRYFLYPDAFNYGFHSENSKCDYTNTFNGTSAATPVVSGVVALMLEANPNLTWRDVKHILAKTADKIDLPATLGNSAANVITNTNNLYSGSGFVYDYKWVKNAKDVHFSNWYGFGKVNAYNAVQSALTYTSALGTYEETMNSSGTWYYESGDVDLPISLGSETSSKIWVGHNFVVEHVQIELTTSHDFPGDLSVILVSPSGTESRLMNINNKIFGGPLEDFKMATNAFYEEESNGFWTLKVFDGSGATKNISYNSSTGLYTLSLGTGNLVSWKILVSGHRKTSELTKPYPSTGINIVDTAGVGAAPTSFSYNPPEGLNSAQYIVGVFKTNGSAVIDWIDNGSQQNFNVNPGQLNVGEVYQFKVKAIDPDTGLESAIQLKEWTEQ